MTEKRHPKRARGPEPNISKTPKSADPRTLFVKFNPPSASITRQHLSDHFSNYGPVNRCSVIRQSKPKNSSKCEEHVEVEDGTNNANLDRGSKGYGFVRFVHEEDAKAAAQAIRNRSQKGKNGEVMVVDGLKYRIHAERAVDAATTSSSDNGAKQQNALQDEKEQTATSSSSVATTTADADGNNDTSNLKAEAKRKRTSRVIIRNLSFYASEKHVKNAMEDAFGPVSAVDLPLVPLLPHEKEANSEGGRKNKNARNVLPRHRGFAFVTFTNANSAKKAVEQGNEIKIKNRVVAIDFSVSKVEHQKMMKEEKEGDHADDDESESGADSETGEEGEDEGEGKVGREDAGERGSEDDSEDDDDDDNSSIVDDENNDSQSENNLDEESENKEEEESPTKTTDRDKTPQFDEGEAKRTLFLRNIPFDATRHDIFELFKSFGRIQAVHLVKDPQTGVFRGTAFVRFVNEEVCKSALEASGVAGNKEADKDGDFSQFISGKNIAIGLGQDRMSGLMLKGRHILVNLAVDRTTASSLTVQRDADGKPLKKMVGKDRRNLYLKNEGRVSSSTDSAAALSASAKYGGVWEDLPKSDQAKRERVFADKATKLRSPLFFINPTRLSIRNLSKHVNESDLKRLVIGALRTGIEQKLVTPNDAVAHWRASGELAHSEVMRRATDPKLVIPPFEEKNTKQSIPSVFIDRDLSSGKKTADAPSRGFGFVEFTHHSHALACLRQLNNNPVYSAEYAAGGKHATEMAKQHQRRGKKSKKMKVDDSGSEFIGQDGKVCVPRLIVEFAVENKVKARLQAGRLAQKNGNKIKQKIENKEKPPVKEEKEKRKSRGAIQREKKRARKEAGIDGNGNECEASESKKSKKEQEAAVLESKEVQPKTMKPKKKRKVDRDEEALEDMIRYYKATFSHGAEKDLKEKEKKDKTQEISRESVVKRRWFE